MSVWRIYKRYDTNIMYMIYNFLKKVNCEIRAAYRKNVRPADGKTAV